MLAPWKESCDEPRQCIRKQRHHFANKGPYSQSYGFFQSSCMDTSWTIKKTECQRIDVLKLWCWRRLLRVSWPAKRSNLLILEEINPGCSLEGPMMKLKLQYSGHLMWRDNSLARTLMLGKIEEGAEEDEPVGWHHRLSGHGFEQTPGDSEGQQSRACCSSWSHRESVSNWTTTAFLVLKRLTAETTRPTRKSGKPAEDIHTSEVPARPLLPARMMALPSPR